MVFFVSGCSDEDFKDIICASKDKDLATKVFCFAIGSSKTDSNETGSAEEKKGECVYDSDCSPICDGDITYKRGCNPRTNTCEKTFETNCADYGDKFGYETFKYICKDAECVPNYDAIQAKKTELNQRIIDLNAARPVLIEIRGKADSICKLGTNIDPSAKAVELPPDNIQELMGSPSISALKNALYSKSNTDFVQYNCELVTGINYDLANTNTEIKDAQTEVSDMSQVLSNR